MENKKALLFINGTPPKHLPSIGGYDLIACTDGAFHYLKAKKFPLEKLDFISGDFDSHSGIDEDIYTEKFICTPDQEKTDFEKSLEILIQRGIQKVDVFGASGGEMDHFLGNLAVGLMFKNQREIHFFDDFSTYYFADKNLKLQGVKGKMISLFPFPKATNVFSKGLNWPLNGETLELQSKIGTRNFASEDEVSITYSEGDLLIFVGEKYH